METPNYSPSHHVDGSRPSIGFPLGTALLLIVIFSLSGIFSCCYHWDKLRSFRRSFSNTTDLEADYDHNPSKLKATHMGMEHMQKQSFTVLMPGDEIPKFIAMPCPCEPPRLGKIIVEVQNPPPKPPSLALPLY